MQCWSYRYIRFSLKWNEECATMYVTQEMNIEGIWYYFRCILYIKNYLFVNQFTNKISYFIFEVLINEIILLYMFVHLFIYTFVWSLLETNISHFITNIYIPRRYITYLRPNPYHMINIVVTDAMIMAWLPLSKYLHNYVLYMNQCLK